MEERSGVFLVQCAASPRSLGCSATPNGAQRDWSGEGGSEGGSSQQANGDGGSE